MAGWTHKEPPEVPHPPDPHYNGNGLPAFWTCHAKVGKETCNGRLLLAASAPPITIPPARKAKSDEPDMSGQP